MLVLQGLFGAFATGAANAGDMLDAFGNPLCITSTQGSGQPEGDRDHSALPDCCTGICGMFAPLTVAERTAHSLFNPLAVFVKIETPRRAASFQPAPDHDPGSPRAPPLPA